MKRGTLTLPLELKLETVRVRISVMCKYVKPMPTDIIMLVFEYRCLLKLYMAAFIDSDFLFCTNVTSIWRRLGCIPQTLKPIKVNVLYRRRRCALKWVYNITKTCLYNFDPLKPHFYIVKLGFTGVYLIFLISAQKHRLWYSLEPPRRGGSNEYPQSMF